MKKIEYKTSADIRSVFDSIALKYDFLNNLISFFMHKVIKKRAIKMLKITNNASVSDLCCGSGDLAAIIKRQCPNCNVTGVDFSNQMLAIAKKKHENIDFLYGDAMNLQFNENQFDYVVMGFGLRNIKNKITVLNEVYRVLRQDGYFMHIDFGAKNFASKIFDFITLVCAKLFSNKYNAYEYLIESKKSFLTPAELIKIYKKSGYKNVYRKDFLFGVISCQIVKK